MLKAIIGYKGVYEVSEEGKVRNSKTGRILKPVIARIGYHMVNLYYNGNANKYYIHRLVATAFLENPDNKPQINHKNGIKSDNCVDNLEWCTRSENQKHRYDVLGYKGVWLGKFGKNNHLSKTILQYSKSGEFIQEWGSIMDIQRNLGINQGNISSCCIGRYKSAGGFIFKFKYL